MMNRARGGAIASLRRKVVEIDLMWLTFEGKRATGVEIYYESSSSFPLLPFPFLL